MDKLYENIKKRREELGMSQRDLAYKSGYSDHTTITKMEKGDVDLTIKRLKMNSSPTLINFCSFSLI